MFEASLTPMGEAAEDLKKITNEIQTRRNELDGPWGVLRELTYMEEPLHRIRIVQQRLENKAVQSMKMRMTLEQICLQYQNTENAIIDYCEETAASSRRRERAGVTDIAWVAKWIQDQAFRMPG